MFITAVCVIFLIKLRWAMPIRARVSSTGYPRKRKGLWVMFSDQSPHGLLLLSPQYLSTVSKRGLNIFNMATSKSANTYNRQNWENAVSKVAE